jgi:hypothetical protein
MFLSERTMIHMQWHKDGERENKDVLVHPLDSDAWKALDNFDPEFAQDERNVRIGEEHNVNALTLRYNVDEEPPLSDLKKFQWRGTTASSNMTYYYTQEE